MPPAWSRSPVRGEKPSQRDQAVCSRSPSSAGPAQQIPEGGRRKLLWGAQGTVREDLTPPAPLPRVSCAVKGRSLRLTGHSPLSSVQNLQARLRVLSPGGVHVRSLCIHPTGAAEFSRPGRLPGDAWRGLFGAGGFAQPRLIVTPGRMAKSLYFFKRSQKSRFFCQI